MESDLAYIDGTDLKTATPSDVADTYLQNADTNRFKALDKSRLGQFMKSVVLTQAAYDALPEIDQDTFYYIEP